MQKEVGGLQNFVSLCYSCCCDKLDHLIAHYKRIGGDESVIKCTELLKSELLEPVSMLQHDLAIVSACSDSFSGLSVRVLIHLS